jgi:hypothetical protein
VFVDGDTSRRPQLLSKSSTHGDVRPVPGDHSRDVLEHAAALLQAGALIQVRER